MVYVPCCLNGIELEIEGRSKGARLARESECYLTIFYHDETPDSMTSADHAGVHFWPTAYATYSYGGDTWYRWQLDPIVPEDLFLPREDGKPNFRVTWSCRNDSVIGTCPGMDIDKAQLKFTFFKGTAIEQTVSLDPIAHSGWSEAGGVYSHGTVLACDDSEHLILDYGPIDWADLAAAKVITEAGQTTAQFIKATIEGETYCFKVLEATDESPFNNASVAEIADCADAVCNCTCAAATAAAGITPSHCSCSPDCGGDPFYCGGDNAGDWLGYPVVHDNVHSGITLINTSASWHAYLWLKPFDLEDFVVLWQGSRCSDWETNSDFATEFEMYYLAQSWTADYYDGTAIKKTVTISEAAPLFEVPPTAEDVWRFVGVSFNSTTGVMTFRVDGTEKSTAAGVITPYPTPDWITLGHSGRPEFTLGGFSYSFEGCVDGLTIGAGTADLLAAYNAGCP